VLFPSLWFDTYHAVHEEHMLPMHVVDLWPLRSFRSTVNPG
jgi:hypothetical protein